MEAVVVGAWLLVVGLGMWVAGRRGRPTREGFVLALLFGPLGVIVECLLPIGGIPQRTPAKVETPRKVLPPRA